MKKDIDKLREEDCQTRGNIKPCGKCMLCHVHKEHDEAILKDMKEIILHKNTCCCNRVYEEIEQLLIVPQSLAKGEQRKDTFVKSEGVDGPDMVPPIGTPNQDPKDVCSFCGGDSLDCSRCKKSSKDVCECGHTKEEHFNEKPKEGILYPTICRLTYCDCVILIPPPLCF